MLSTEPSHRPVVSRLWSDETKAVVLAVLGCFSDGCTVGDIVGHSEGLTRAQVASVLRRGEQADYVEVRRNVQLIPSGKGSRYRLAPRGELWLAWAASEGLVAKEHVPEELLNGNRARFLPTE